MAHYRLSNPNISSLSFDGVEHKVNDQGFLEIEDRLHSHALHVHLTEVWGGEVHHPTSDSKPPEAPPPVETTEQILAREQAMADENERQRLFVKMDEATGRRTDRRRSVQQLRVMWQDHLAASGIQAKSEEQTGAENGYDTHSSEDGTGTKAETVQGASS